MIGHQRATFAQRFFPVLKQRCPRCLEGKVFAGLMKMHSACPLCGYDYEREPGYYTGAMYISYGLAVISLIPTGVILFFLGLPDLWSFSILGVQLVVTSPILFRYSRVLWLHLDHMIFPEDE